ncbi:MAG: DUF2948 family protein [Alphaproteobacteria bacterium]|nr:DUF2948 family protein [Alphaproteobacteria bacterium]
MSKDFVPLRLLAKDEEDLTILATHLQDSFLPLLSMVYEPKESLFTMLANRFCWEHPSIEHEGEPMYHRVHSGLSFLNVENVHYRGFHRKKGPEILNLLTLQAEKGNAIRMICAGGHEIRIVTKKLHCHLGDIHHPWPTRKKPQHIYQHIEHMQAGGR